MSILVTTALLSTLSAQVPAAQQQVYGQLLKKYVIKGRVDYAKLEKESLAQLDAYVKAVGQAKLPKSKEAKIGFYIDAYNAIVLHSVLEHGQPRSVLDEKGFFNAIKYPVAGEQLTLDTLEKKRLLPLAKDPRVHFVVVCAAVGCPILQNRAYTGGKLSQRLNQATRKYLAMPTGARVEKGKLILSKIFDWYAADFGGPQGVKKFVLEHLSAEKRALAGKDPSIGYLDYNWTLNRQ